MKMKVLIIEDHPVLRELLIEQLKDLKITSFAASNGIEGLSMLETEIFDLIFVDVEMPFMNGMDFIINAKKKYPNLPPIHIMTGHSPFSEEEFYQHGATGYVTKPFFVSEYLEKIIPVERLKDLACE